MKPVQDYDEKPSIEAALVAIAGAVMVWIMSYTTPGV